MVANPASRRIDFIAFISAIRYRFSRHGFLHFRFALPPGFIKANVTPWLESQPVVERRPNAVAARTNEERCAR
jgi:hypothetical protein